MTKAHMANGEVSYKEYQNKNKYFRCWSVLTPYDPFYLGNIFGMVTRNALQVSRSGQGYIDLYKSLEWPRKWGTNFKDGPEPEAPRSL